MDGENQEGEIPAEQQQPEQTPAEPAQEEQQQPDQ